MWNFSCVCQWIFCRIWISVLLTDIEKPEKNPVRFSRKDRYSLLGAGGGRWEVHLSYVTTTEKTLYLLDFKTCVSFASVADQFEAVLETLCSCDKVGRELCRVIMCLLMCPETDWSIRVGKQSGVVMFHSWNQSVSTTILKQRKTVFWIKLISFCLLGLFTWRQNNCFVFF